MFSGAGRISAKSRTLSPSLLSDYVFCHYNYKYDWPRPSLEEIFGAYKYVAYKKLYGKHGRDSDAESDNSSEEEEQEQEEEEGEEGEGEGAEDEGE